MPNEAKAVMKQSCNEHDESCAFPAPAGVAAARRERRSVRAFMALICVAYLAHVYVYNYVCDDTFISMRYARNLAEGHGLVFNPGDRVEGFTSPLWTLLLAGIHWLGGDLLLWARLLGVIAGLCTIMLSYRLAALCTAQRLPPIMATLPPLILAANGSFACWSASGMEAVPYVCLVLASFVAICAGRLPAAAGLSIAVVLTRPDSFVLLPVFGTFLLLQHPRNGLKPTVGWFIACGAAIAALFLARFLYYGDWLPNTYYAKVGGGLHAAVRGIRYLREYAADHEGLILIMLPLLYYGVLRGTIRQRFLAAGVAALWLGTVLVGGDGLPMYRFALAPMPLLAVLHAHLIAELYGAVLGSASHRWKQDTAVGVATLLLISVHATKPLAGYHYKRYADQQLEITWWTNAGKWFARNAKEHESIAAVPIGAVSYYARIRVFDMLGLTDRHIAHRDCPSMGTGWAGHEKSDGPYILGRRPTYLLLGNIDVTDQPRDPTKRPFIPYRSMPVWQRERDIYSTGEIYSLYKPRSVRIAPGQYLNFYELREEYRSAPDTP